MWIILSSFFKGLWTRVSFGASIAGAVVIALGIAWLKGRSAGKAEYVRRREIEKQKAAAKSQEIRHAVRNDSDDTIDRRLDKWMRD